MAVILFEAIVEMMEILDWGIWNGLGKERRVSFPVRVEMGRQ